MKFAMKSVPFSLSPFDGGSTPNPLTLEQTSESLLPVRVLLVDPDTAFSECCAGVLREEGYDVVTTTTGTEALEWMHQNTFDVLLTDLTLPDRSGLDLLETVLTLASEMPVVFLTGQGSVEVARRVLTLGASDFITKPCSPGDLPLFVERNLTPGAVQRRKIQRNQRVRQTSGESVLDTLLTALSSRDTEPHGHSERVTAYTMEIADCLQIAPAERFHIERGALLHDIGKIGIPDRILLKPAELTPEEWIEIKKHPIIGHQMCARIEMLQKVSLIVLHHHEAWDGSGYPHGLAGSAIPLGARIFAIADTFDAITSDKPYRPTRSIEAACAEIERCSGTQFDPTLVAVFLTIPLERLRQIRALTDK